MDVTISIDDELLDRARRLARRRGTSIDELIREQLRLVVGERCRADAGGARTGADAGRELLDLIETHAGRSGGRRWRRDDLYAGRV